MSPIITDLERLPDTDELRRRLSCDQSDNLARNDLAVVLHLSGALEEALAALSKGPAPGLGSGLVRLNRLYLEEVQETGRAYEVQRQEDLDRRILKIIRPAREQAPFFSVVMPTYNRVDKIRPSVESVLAQTCGDFELVLVNDGGDREVERVVREFGSDRIVYVDAAHKGLAGALNLGVHVARGNFIARLDDDDLFLPGHLAAARAHLEQHPGCHALYTDHEMRLQEKRGEGYETVEVRPGAGREWYLSAFREGMFFTSNNVVIRRSVFDEVGPYRESYPTREDWEFYLRVGERFGFHHVPELTVVYFMRTDSTNMTHANRRGFFHYANLSGCLHGLYSITSSLWRPYGSSDRRTRKVIRGLDRVMDVNPEAIKLIYLKKLALLERKKPYTFFMEWANSAAQDRELQGLAPLIFRQAWRMNPLEPGPIRELIRRGRASQSD